MVNLVLVSHSAKLVEGLADILRQMAPNGCQIAPAGGIDDEANPIGTDAVKIMNAIEEVYSDDGVVIFVDLGSAILSAETAIDLLDPEKAAKVKICYAPLVEGAFAAAISASTGDSMETVMQEALSAAALKVESVSK